MFGWIPLNCITESKIKLDSPVGKKNEVVYPVVKSYCKLCFITTLDFIVDWENGKGLNKIFEKKCLFDFSNEPIELESGCILHSEMTKGKIGVRIYLCKNMLKILCH